jgi:hypothetical protein
MDKDKRHLIANKGCCTQGRKILNVNKAVKHGMMTYVTGGMSGISGDRGYLECRIKKVGVKSCSIYILV